ncbi:MAG: mannose-1-phosphate guanylyltransferase [Candidatus Hodarchaeales archaeon]|jgi:mannose-1-phosphate guanylyltransferase
MKGIKLSNTDKSTPIDKVICCIMAGGKGERFWPDSRLDNPKQLLKIATEKTLVETTVDNLSPLLLQEQIIISTNPVLESILKRVLPELDFWTEPVPRDTAACIGFCTYKSLKYGQDTVLIFVGADYFIADKHSFQQHLETAIDFAKQGKIVTLGIQPTRPAIGFGYIQLGNKLSGDNVKHEVYEVERFREKPDKETALQYIENGFLWNSGMFIVKNSVMIEAFKKHLPIHHEILEEVYDNDFEPQKSLELFETLQMISIDYGIMEKEKDNLVVVKSSFGWDDLGDWTALDRYYELDSNKNIIIGENLSIETRNCIIKSDKAFIVTYGIEDLIIVENKGSILVIPKQHSQKIKEVLERMGKNESYSKYL